MERMKIRKFGKFVGILCLVLLASFGVQAQTIDGPQYKAVDEISAADQTIEQHHIYFRFDKINLDRSYLDNAKQFDRISDYVKNSPHIDSITIYAWASPEGVYEHNVKLSRQRAEAAKRYILSQLPEGSSFTADHIRILPMEENWIGLREELRANYHRHDRKRVLRILDAKIPNDTKKWRLKQLDGGYTYNYIIRKHMPRLRLAAWVTMYGAPVPEPAVSRVVQSNIAQTPDIVEQPQQFQPEPVITPISWSTERTILALKTNALYDLGTAVNFAVEAPLGDRFSVLYNHICPWWLSKDNKYCFEFLSMGGEARYWIKPEPRPASEKRVVRDRLVGHFVGLYGMGGKFDFQWKEWGCYQGEFMSAGLSYGYAMPIGKRLNLEFSLSVGYARIPYRHYVPTNDWQDLIRDKFDAGTLHYVGPTKAEVSLVIPITVSKKGGLR